MVMYLIEKDSAAHDNETDGKLSLGEDGEYTVRVMI